MNITDINYINISCVREKKNQLNFSMSIIYLDYEIFVIQDRLYGDIVYL